MKRNVALILPALLLAACSPDLTSPADAAPAFGRDGDAGLSVGAGTIAIVTHPYNAGKGSFREAIAQANTDSRIVRVEFKPEARTIALESSVIFTGSQALTIIGKRATLDARNAGGPAFVANGGGNLRIEDLTVANSVSEGLTVEVPATATGTLTVRFDRVTAIGNAGHGILVNDQVNSSTTDGVQPDARGSAASLDVRVNDARFLSNGYSVSDRDGLRVNEGGLGSLTFTARGARAEDNAADGIELDERGDGDVVIDVEDTRILRNGKLDPDDLDDGFDVDEYDAGSIVGILRNVTASDNYEEGLDFNENNAGDLRVDLYGVEANGNREEGIDYEEDDDFAGGGDLVTTMQNVVANGNGADDGDAGLKVREKGTGDLTANIAGVVASNNAIGGIFIREDAAGQLVSNIVGAETKGNASHGIDIDENRATSTDVGNLTATVMNAVSTGNAGAGIRADQQLPGVGSLTVTNVILTPNAGGSTTGSNVVLTIVP
ncbi:hypothetical protein [Gemmatimonas sp.]|uniref:hypothetical protein n=1 Tax=Gemmatimonas sp. TaxID=1962908 RepID=UPI003983AAE9